MERLSNTICADASQTARVGNQKHNRFQTVIKADDIVLEKDEIKQSISKLKYVDTSRSNSKDSENTGNKHF